MATMHPHHHERPHHFHPPHGMSSRAEIMLLVGGILVCTAIAVLSYVMMRG